MSLLRTKWLALLLLGVTSACGDEPDKCTTCSSDAGDGSAPDAGVDAETVDAEAVDAEPADAGYAWNLPANFPLPKVPEDNPMSAEKVALGRHLFYDKRLSGNDTQSCATCHEQKHAFADTRATGLGSTGAAHARGPMSLANVAYSATFTWANPLMVELERQAQVPMFGTDPVELGLTSHEELVGKLGAVDKYKELFAAAFADDPEPISVLNTVRALASFERSLISGNSPFDRYKLGDESAVSDGAKRGEQLFLNERYECFHCHGGFSFSDQLNHSRTRVAEAPFHNNALYNIDGMGGYPPDSQGLITFTGLRDDMGKFKAPTLRNIAVTAPYMHDGSIATLSEVLDHYAAGGRKISEGPYAGNGFDNRFKSEFLHGFVPTEQERADLLAFLESLTDDEFLTNPAHSDPWPAAP